MVSSTALLVALCVIGETTIAVKDGNGNPVPGAAFQISRSERFDAQDVIAEGGRTNSVGETVTNQITQEKVRGVRTLHARALSKGQGHLTRYGPSATIKCDGHVPERIELLLDQTLRTCVPIAIPPCGWAAGCDCERLCCCCPCWCCREELVCSQRLLDITLKDTDAGAATLTAVVPGDALVFINGRRTTKTGTYREYCSVGLQPGCTYRYDVCTQVVRDGRTIEDTREVMLRVGETRSVAFDFSGENSLRLTKAR